MSNPLAIAAVTGTLRHLLVTQAPLIDAGLADLEVTTHPLDLARKGVTKAQLNIFLYQTVVNAAWRNHDLPGQVRPGETGSPPLALNLHYLITAYGRGDSDNDSVSHRVLGSAMSVLHDHPLLGAAEIAAALADNDLAKQFERVRITPLPLGVEEMSKLWTIFQSQYRLSVAYEAAVVLIDSRRPVRAPLPVLKRGPEDRGVIAVAGLPPVLDSLRLPKSQSAIRLGEDVVLVGQNLSVEGSDVVFRSALLADDITLPPVAGPEPGELTVHIDDVADDPDAMSRWHPGFYVVTLAQSRADAPPISSNAQPFALAPRIKVTPLAAVKGDALIVTCEPRLRAGQRALLIFGDRQIQPAATDNPPDLKQPTSLEFIVPEVETNSSYVVRLRVDGVDSIPAIYTGVPAIPAFDPQQTVVM